MKKLTLLLSGLFFCLFSFAQSPQLVPGDYQNYQTPSQSGTKSSLGEFVPFGGSIIFTSENRIWKTDGSVNGTFVLKEFKQNDSLRPIGLKEMNGNIYFFADDGIHGNELWSTDGTSAGTVLIKDINPGPANSVEWKFINGTYNALYKIELFNNKIYFAANDGTHGIELWNSDGTEQGTVMFDDLNPGAADGMFNPRLILAAGNKLYFGAEKPDPLFVCLYATDGTLGGTTLCLDTFATLIIETMIPYGNKVIFSTSINFTNVFISDGTEAGTFILLPGMSNPNDVAVINGKAYFFAGQDYSFSCDLIETDGTIAGTQVIDNVFGGLQNYETKKRYFLQVYNNQLFFCGAHSGSIGLLKSDGALGGTTLVKNISPYSGPYHLTHFNGKLYFKANDPNRHDLWYSDGTTGGTQMMTVPGSVTNDGSSYYSRKYYNFPMVSTGNALYYYNRYDSTGVRIYKLDQFPADVNSAPKLSSIDIYPNPTQGIITIDAENAKSISIHSINGSLVYKKENISNTKHTVDTHNFASGTYTITTLLSDGTKRYGKFVKQ